MITWLLYKTVRFGTSAIRCRGKTLRVFVADTPAKQMLGLMHREKLRSNEGMLFVFGRDSKWGIWMANMKFSIDIVWLGKDGKVVSVIENAEPCKSIFNCKTRYPSRSARYVLELPSGSASRMGIKEGESVSLPSML